MALSTSFFFGETVCFTGTLKNPGHMPRKAASSLVLANGGFVSARLTKKTTVLVCGVPNPRFDPSRKLARARERQVRILSMDEFFLKIGLPSQLSFAF